MIDTATLKRKKMTETGVDSRNAICFRHASREACAIAQANRVQHNQE